MSKPENALLSSATLKNNEFVLSNFELTKDKSGKNLLLMGQGIYGPIYLGKQLETNKKFAIKYIKKAEVDSLEHDLEIIRKRLDIHKSVQHPNIIRLYNYTEDKDKIILFLEYAKKGNLFKKLINEQRLSEEKAYEYFIQIAEAINFLHSSGFAHRNIKSENILLDKNDNIKLCNLGWCIDVSGKENDAEAQETNSYNKGCDALALGVVLYEMLHGVSGSNKNQGFKISAEIGLSEEVKDILNKLLEINNSKRMDVKDVFGHPWVKKMRKNEEKVNFSGKFDYLNTDGNLTFRMNKRGKNIINKKNNTASNPKAIKISKFSTTSSSGSFSNENELNRIRSAIEEKNEGGCFNPNASFNLYDLSPSPSPSPNTANLTPTTTPQQTEKSPKEPQCDQQNSNSQKNDKFPAEILEEDLQPRFSGMLKRENINIIKNSINDITILEIEARSSRFLRREDVKFDLNLEEEKEDGAENEYNEDKENKGNDKEKRENWRKENKALSMNFDMEGFTTTGKLNEMKETTEEINVKKAENLDESEVKFNKNQKKNTGNVEKQKEKFEDFDVENVVKMCKSAVNLDTDLNVEKEEKKNKVKLRLAEKKRGFLDGFLSIFNCDK